MANRYRPNTSSEYDHRWAQNPPLSNAVHGSAYGNMDPQIRAFGRRSTLTQTECQQHTTESDAGHGTKDRQPKCLLNVRHTYSRYVYAEQKTDGH
jgi:hypothetical protein